MTMSNNNNNQSNFISHNKPLNSLVTSPEGYVNKRKKLEPIPLLEGIEEIRNDFEERLEQGDTVYGIEILDDYVETIRKGSITYIIAQANTGKALTLDTKILTPNGWVPNKNINVGDYVIGRNGQPTRVIGVFPQGITKTFDVKFADGRTITTSPEHLWSVEGSPFKGVKNYTTEELYSMIQKSTYKNRLHVPQYSGNHGSDKQFIIPPYVLGVLIGDGCLTATGLAYCKPSQKVFDKVKKFLPNRDISFTSSGKNVSIKKSRDLKQELRRMGLLVKSFNKFIPREYIDGTSKKQRLELLEGLLDTDGYQSKSYNEFSTTSEQLAKDVRELSWSLGYDCRITSRLGRYSKNNKTINTRINYRVYISNARTKAQAVIRSIEPSADALTQCIAVDAPDKLFVTENYIVTHNSLWSQQIACNLAKQGKKVLICSCEMGAGLLMERQIKILAGVETMQLKNMYASQRDTANYILDSMIEDEKYTFLRNIDVCETGGATIDDIMEMLDCFPEYEYIIVDYIQRIRGSGSEYENITRCSMELQAYARRTGKRLIVCSQASRNSQDNARGAKENSGMLIRGKGSGSIEEDGDVGLSLQELYEDGKKYILATLFKNRYGDKNISYKYILDSRLRLVKVNNCDEF